MDADLVEAIRVYQARADAWLDTRRKGWIALDQGLGKTNIALKRIHEKTVAVVPSFLIPNWVEQAKLWRPDLQVAVADVKSCFQTGAMLEIVSYHTAATLNGTTKRKAASAKQQRSLVFGEHVRGLPGSRLKFHSLFKRIIVDESHYIADGMSQRGRACRGWIMQAEEAYLLSGTPTLGRPIDLWNPAFAMGITRLTRTEWGQHYCKGHKGKWGGWDFSGATNKRLPELQALLAPYVFRLTKEETLSLPTKFRRLVMLDGAVDKRELAYDVGQIERNPNPVSFEGLAEILREHGIRKVAPSIQYIRDVLETEPCVIVYAHHHDVVKALETGLAEYGVTTITGLVESSKRHQLVKDFEAGKGRVLIASIAAFGVGFTVVRCAYGIFVEATWSRAKNVQAEDRMHRIGQTRRCQFDYLVVNRSIDARMVDVAMSKARVTDQVLGDSQRIAMAGLGLGPAVASSPSPTEKNMSSTKADIAAALSEQSRVTKSTADVLGKTSELLKASADALAIIAGALAGAQPVIEGAAAAQTPPPTDKPAGRGPGRPPKNAPAASAQAAPAAAISRDAVVSDLKRVFDEKGKDVCLGLLAEFNCKAVKEIKDEQLAGVAKRCAALLGSEADETDSTDPFS